MTNAEKQVATRVLQEIMEALLEGAAGPTDYWYKKLAERLAERTLKILREVES